MATVLEQLACERKSENIFVATLLAPPRAFFGFSSYGFGLLLYSWALIIILYIVLYFFVPLCFLNSSNGFRSGSAVTISTVVIFAVIVMIYVLWARKGACESKERKLQYYLKGRRPDSPRYLENAIQRVTAKPENKFRPLEPWRPVDV